MTDQNSKSALSTRLTAGIGPLLAAIPSVGGSLSAAWSEWDTGRRFRRLEQTIAQIHRKLASIPALNSWAADDAGMQILELVLREAQIEHCDKKRERFANLVVSSWISENPPAEAFDETMLFIRATSQLTDSHIAALQSLYDADVVASVPFADIASIVSAEDTTPTERDEAALIVLDDLCSRFVFAKRAWDLNNPDVKSAILVTQNLSPEGIARKCFHAITLRGKRYIEYVVQGPAPRLG